MLKPRLVQNEAGFLFWSPYTSPVRAQPKDTHHRGERARRGASVVGARLVLVDPCERPEPRKRRSPQSLSGLGASKIRQRPTLPRGFPRSTIGSGGLNFRVRDGNGCDPSDIATGKASLHTKGRFNFLLRCAVSSASRSRVLDPLLTSTLTSNPVLPHGSLLQGACKKQR